MNNETTKTAGELSLAQLKDQPPSVLDHLPIDVLVNLQTQAEAHAAEAGQMLAILHGVFERRYAAGINNTGTHHRHDGDIETTINVPKRVDWDQIELSKAVETIKGWNENPADYVETKMTVKEAAYSNWPPAIRDLFTPARTVKKGKASFKFANKAAAERQAA